MLLVSSHVEQETVFVDRDKGELNVSTLSQPRCSAANNSMLYVPALAFVDNTRPTVMR